MFERSAILFCSVKWVLFLNLDPSATHSLNRIKKVVIKKVIIYNTLQPGCCINSNQ